MPEEGITTRLRILEVIEGMEEAGSIMSVSGVAREVGISHSAIFNRYSDLAERIRVSAGKVKEKDAQVQLATRLGKLKEEKEKRAKLREELVKIKEELRKANSINAALQLENASLKAELNDTRGRSRSLMSLPQK